MVKKGRGKWSLFMNETCFLYLVAVVHGRREVIFIEKEERSLYLFFKFDQYTHNFNSFFVTLSIGVNSNESVENVYRQT